MRFRPSVLAATLAVAIALAQAAAAISPADAADAPFSPGVRLTAPLAVSSLGIAIADFNRDGNPDYAVTSAETDSVSILLGDGRGGTAPRKSYATADVPRGLAVTDLNGDGWQDLVIAASGGAVSVLMARPGGEFRNRVDTPINASPFSVAVADFNGDSKVDVVVGGTGSASFFLLRGTGTGTFAPTVEVPINAIPISVAAGDVDNDGKADIVTVSSTSNYVLFMRGDGAGGFAPKVEYTVAMQPDFIALGDLNADGFLDVVSASSLFNQANYLYGNGTGFTSPAQSVLSGGSMIGVALGDVSGDGLADIVFALRLESNLRILRADGLGGFLPSADVDMGGASNAIALADVNHDGRLDLAAPTSTPAGGRLAVLLNYGTGPLAQKTTYHAPGTPGQVRLGDLDGDTHLDLIHLGFNAGTFSVRLGDGDGAFGARVDYPSPVPHPASFDLGDADGDTDLDLLIVSADRDSVYLKQGNGMGQFTSGVILGTGSAPRGVTFGRVNSDVIPDLVVANSNSASVSVFLGEGGNIYGPRTDYAAGTTPVAVVVTDLNADGHRDLLCANRGSHNVSVRMGVADGSGILGTKFDYAVGQGPTGIAVADLNADGKPDLVSSNSISGGASVLFGTGATPGTFFNAVDYASDTSPAGVVITDIDGDLRLDVLLANDGGASVTVHLGDALGRLAAPRHSLPSGIGTTSLAIGDLDEDGRPDLVSSAGGIDSIAVRLSRGTTTIALAASPNPCAFGATLTLTATMTGPDGVHVTSGVVRFYDGIGLIGTAPIVSSVAVLSFPASDAWFRTFMAEFPGTDRLRPSRSGAIELMVYVPSVDVGDDDASGSGLGLSLAVPVPNPVRGGHELTARFTLPTAVGEASLALFDVRGRMIAVQEVGGLGAGSHVVSLRAAGRMPAGLYFLRLAAGAVVVARRVVVVGG